MRYAVVYLSDTGNTKKIAEEIFLALPEGKKKIVDLKKDAFPDADLYFIGFPVKYNYCSTPILDLLECLNNKELAFFSTCGLSPTEEYKKMIFKNIQPWINESCTVRGYFLCQGKSVDSYKESLKDNDAVVKEAFESMVSEGDTHPDDRDFDSAFSFAESIMRGT
ncbi:flavodoxin family protein [Ruminococcus flavefaciens]|uniref:flavodoxin family protein n=1 Tax=Ruminococcus flavefaciens TaxID=1265 RepID=UPI0026EF0853|nr:flavodoxin family protein [Ruminococcus flavefaciens]